MTKIKMMIFYFENWDVIFKKINILLFVMHELSMICKFISFTFCPLRTHLLCSLSVTWANQVNEVLFEVSSVFFVKCYFCPLRCSSANREAWSKAGQCAVTLHSSSRGVHFPKPCHAFSINYFYLVTAFCNGKRWQVPHVHSRSWGKVKWEGSFLPLCDGYLETYELVFLYVSTKMPEIIHFHFDLRCGCLLCVFNIVWSVAWKKILKTADDGVTSGVYLLNVRLSIFYYDQPKKVPTWGAHQLIVSLPAFLSWCRFTCLQVHREQCSCMALCEGLISP